MRDEGVCAWGDRDYEKEGSGKQEVCQDDCSKQKILSPHGTSKIQLEEQETIFETTRWDQGIAGIEGCEWSTWFG